MMENLQEGQKGWAFWGFWVGVCPAGCQWWNCIKIWHVHETSGPSISNLADPVLQQVHTDHFEEMNIKSQCCINPRRDCKLQASYHPIYLPCITDKVPHTSPYIPKSGELSVWIRGLSGRIVAKGKKGLTLTYIDWSLWRLRVEFG